LKPTVGLRSFATVLASRPLLLRGERIVVLTPGARQSATEIRVVSCSGPDIIDSRSHGEEWRSVAFRTFMLRRRPGCMFSQLNSPPRLYPSPETPLTPLRFQRLGSLGLQ